MFPNSTDIMISNETKSSSGTKSYLFDFANDDFVVRDGKLIECDGIDAIKVWIEKILRTEKGRYSIYLLLLRYGTVRILMLHLRMLHIQD